MNQPYREIMVAGHESEEKVNFEHGNRELPNVH